MIAADRVAALLLAAGLSRRFGPQDKLLADFEGRPLAAHARDAIGGFGFAARLAVIRTGAPDLRALFADGGFTLIENPIPADGMASSLRLGAAAARDLPVDALLICLADMPRVDATLLEQLCAAYDMAAGLLVCRDAGRRSPPALIGRRHFDALEQLTGDAGARILLSQAPALDTLPAALLDIDVPPGA